jgi:hypothetical protein
MNKFEYRRLYPFKWFVLQNFPFIEEDFDAITNYQLYCKIVEYLNKVIDNNNSIGAELEVLVNAFNNLQDYVNNYFDNLDIQTEINNKLDEMAESGELTELLTAYLQLKCIYGYNNIEEMKVASNLVDGSFVKTYGKNSLNDGYGAFYKIRTIENTDIIDNENIVALDNPNLIAEKIIENIVTPFAQLIDTSIFAQLIPQNINVSQHGCQSFAIGNGIMVTCWTAYQGDDNGANRGILIATNITTGSQIAVKTNQSIGHCNDITYCEKDGYFYIACGGGYNPLEKIVVIDINLNIIREIDMTNTDVADPFGIAYNYNKDVFYIRGANYDLFEMDYNLDRILKRKATVTQNVQSESQGLIFDGKNLSVITAITNTINPISNYNKLDVYSQDLEYICSQKIFELNEIGDGCYYNGELYLMKWFNHIPLFYKASQYINEKTYNKINEDIIMGNAFSNYGAFYNIYINKDYTGFFVDGTQNYPYNDILCALINIKNMFSRVNIYIQGDFSDRGINIQKSDKELNFIGTLSSVKTKIKGFGFRNCKSITIDNFEIVGSSDMSNNQIAIYNTTSVDIKNTSFNGTGNELTTIFATSSNVILESGCSFNQEVVNNIFNIVNGATIKFNGTPSISNVTKAPVIHQSNFGLWYRPPVSFLTQNTDYKTTILGGVTSLNIANISREGAYRVEGGTAVLDAPSGFQASNSGVKFFVKNIGNVLYYLLSSYAGDHLFIGTKNTTNHVTWHQLF